jgi:hypothetical protein
LLFFGWKKILRKAGVSSKRIITAFRAHASTSIPKNRFDPLYAYYGTDFSGESFMLNPTELMNNTFRWKPKEIAQYIGLAALRNYGNYKATGDTTLDLFHSPVDEHTINNNRLLRIQNGKVHFYYEEEPKRRKLLWQV